MSQALDTLVISHKPINEYALKRLILIFDHIHIIHPKENHFLLPANTFKFVYNKTTIMPYKMKTVPNKITIVPSDYGVFYNSDTYYDLENKVIDKFDYALKKGIIKITDLKERNFYNKYWLPLRLSYDFDTANKEFLESTISLLENDSLSAIKNGVERGMFIEPQGIKTYPDIPEIPDIFSDDENRKYNYQNQSFTIIGKLNRALIACGEYNLFPTFLNPALARLFISKYKAAKNNSEKNLNHQYQKMHNMELQKIQHLLYEMSEAILPDKIIKEIPIKELIIARNNTFQELHKLRRNVVKSIRFLSNNSFDENFLNESKKYIVKEFEPQIKDYYSNFCNVMAKFSNYLYGFVFGLGGYKIGLMQSLSPLEIGVLTGISATVPPVVSDLTNYIVKKDKDKFKNTYAYFLNFRS